MAHNPAPIDRLIDERLVQLVFQPVVDLSTKTIFGYEALARPMVDEINNPMEAIIAAIAAGRIGELGRLWRQLAVDGCTQYPLFLNVRPEEFDEGWLVRPDDPIYWHEQRVYLELTESAPLSSFKQCNNILAEARAKGIYLAIDDLGSGYSNLIKLAEFNPEIVKLDRILVTGLEPGTRQFRLVRGVIRLCKEMDARVVAEGIETEEELAAVIEAGAHFGQGWVFGKPQTPPPPVIWPLAEPADQAPPRHLLLVNLTERNDSWTLPSFVCHSTDSVRDAARLLGKQAFDCVVVHASQTTPAVDDVLRRLQEASGGAIIPQCLTAQPEDRTTLALLARESVDGYIDPSWPPSVIDAVLQAAIHRVEIGRRLAIQDDLTQLLNRRHFETLLATEHHRAKRYQRSYTIVMIDLDGLKAINEHYGHRAGSTVLCRIGRVIAAESRRSDLAFRYGGDEFVVLLAETDKKGAEIYCERLRASIEQTEISYESHYLSVTASIGIAAYPEDGELSEDVFAKADEALYRAKSAGKNRVAF